MSRITAKRRKIVAVWALIAFLISHSAMAFHLCLPVEIASGAASSSTSSTHERCGASGHQVEVPGTSPCQDAWCALHCVKPDELASSAKWPLPDAILTSQFPVAPSPVMHRLALTQRDLMEAPQRDARRRLIEYGALLI